MNPGQSVARHFLLAHPGAQSGAAQDLVQELSVKISRPSQDQLTLDYRLVGDLASLRLPEPRSSVRSDGLWRHSCFEGFVGHAGANDYWEYNFSPSGAWAAYHFTGYREGMAPLMKGAAPQITQKIGSDSCEVLATLDLSWLAKSSAGIGLRLGLAAVIEDRARVLSYWALKHPTGKPDFHHADSFVVALD
ncbi:MAG: DOMON-like domain-containing protein [Pseudomonadota bacterium]